MPFLDVGNAESVVDWIRGIVSKSNNATTIVSVFYFNKFLLRMKLLVNLPKARFILTTFDHRGAMELCVIGVSETR